MHYSDDENNFRNKRYLGECERNFKRMFSSYHVYISYRNKLLNELTMKQEEREELKVFDRKMAKNLLSAYSTLKEKGFFEDAELHNMELKIFKDFFENDNQE